MTLGLSSIELYKLLDGRWQATAWDQSGAMVAQAVAQYPHQAYIFCRVEMR